MSAAAAYGWVGQQKLPTENIILKKKKSAGRNVVEYISYSHEHEKKFIILSRLKTGQMGLCGFSIEKQCQLVVSLEELASATTQWKVW